MTIETKFNIGDEVIFIADNGVHNGQITHIKVYMTSDDTYGYIEYSIVSGNWHTYAKEMHLYRTKEELIEKINNM